jgi:hypothetical protein
MPELTLESLAARVEALEQARGMPPGAIPLKNGCYTIPGTGDWAAAEGAAKRLADTYDFDAFRERDEYEWEIARQLAAEAVQPPSPERAP